MVHSNVKMSVKIVCMTMLAVVACSLQARTVALWPIDWDYDNNEYDLRCATNPAYDLTPMKTLTPAGGANTLAWNLPPNPDASDFLFKPATFSSLMSTTGEGYLQANVGNRTLAKDKAYTVEGWVKFTGTGGTGGATWIVMVNTGVAHLRLVQKDGKYYFRVWAPNPTTGGSIDTEFAGPGLTAEELVDGKWHHWAYTQLPNNGNGKRIFEAFWDGASVGTLEDGAVTGTGYTDSNGTFMLGTRGNYGNTIKGGMEYVRISDEVLEPSEFLCAGGGAGTTLAAIVPRTAGYWRLGRDAKGGVDATSAVGGEPFLANPGIVPVTSWVSLSASLDQAFDGQPLNQTVTLAGGNAGSIAFDQDASSKLSIPGLSEHLVASNRDFTVETYFRPDYRHTDMTGSRALFGTMNGNADHAWSLLLCSNPRTAGTSSGRFFRMLSTDPAGNLYWHENVGGEVAGWDGGWKHLALVHHATGGNKGFGYWQIYVDGTLHASVHDSRQIGDVAQPNFILGSSVALAASGKFDCLRVSGAALSPNQFLCATNGTAATDVLAFFPLDCDASGSPYSVFTDVVGSYSQGNAVSADKKASGQKDEPTVTNPDTTAGLSSFGGTTGSIGLGGYGGSNGLLYSCDKMVLNALNETTRSVTIEAYVKHEGGTPSGDENIFIASQSLTSDAWPGMEFRLVYGAKGFKLSDTLCNETEGGTNRFQDKDTNVTMTENDWHHVAFVSDVNPAENKGVWRLYLDGSLKYTSDTLSIRSKRSITGMCVGGRFWGSTMLFRGKIAHLRISRGALAPSEFLNAAPIAEAAATASYWPLDFCGGAFDLANKVSSLLPFGPSLAIGSNERAALKTRQVSVAAEDAANRGSVALASGAYLAATNAAGVVGNLTRPFTVEGWLKWGGAAASGLQTVCGTYRNEHGWKLVLDNTGATPTFRIHGCGRMPTSAFVDAGFGNDASGLADAWRHVALLYDPTGAGSWNLYVDGALAGTVENFWNPIGIDIHQDTFFIGSAPGNPDDSFVGGLDMWRISTGLRSANDLLYPGLPIPGLILIFR